MSIVRPPNHDPAIQVPSIGAFGQTQPLAAGSNLYGVGSPQGIVVASPGTEYRDITEGTPAIWLKTSGDRTNTGWEEISSGSSGGVAWRELTIPATASGWSNPDDAFIFAGSVATLDPMVSGSMSVTGIDEPSMAFGVIISAQLALTTNDDALYLLAAVNADGDGGRGMVVTRVDSTHVNVEVIVPGTSVIFAGVACAASSDVLVQVVSVGNDCAVYVDGDFIGTGAGDEDSSPQAGPFSLFAQGVGGNAGVGTPSFDTADVRVAVLDVLGTLPF